jgi:hypothetical protein
MQSAMLLWCAQEELDPQHRSTVAAMERATEASVARWPPNEHEQQKIDLDRERYLSKLQREKLPIDTLEAYCTIKMTSERQARIKAYWAKYGQEPRAEDESSSDGSESDEAEGGEEDESTRSVASVVVIPAQTRCSVM